MRFAAPSRQSSKVCIAKCLSAQGSLIQMNDAVSDIDHILKNLWDGVDCWSF